MRRIQPSGKVVDYTTLAVKDPEALVLRTLKANSRLDYTDILAFLVWLLGDCQDLRAHPRFDEWRVRR